MNKANFTELSVVDISALLTADQEAAQEAADHLGYAARFCYVAGHGIPQSVFSGVVDAATRFFALPVEEKMKVYIGLSRNHRGYVPEGEEVFAAGSKDRKEAYDLSIDLPSDDPDYVAGNPLLGPNQWLDIVDFRTPVMTYYDAIFSLGRVLIGGWRFGPTANSLRPRNRVRPVKEERYSFPLFFAVDYDSEVSARPVRHAGAAGTHGTDRGRAPLRPDRSELQLSEGAARERRDPMCLCPLSARAQNTPARTKANDSRRRGEIFEAASCSTRPAHRS